MFRTKRPPEAMLALISGCSPWDAYSFDPLTHIKAVNTLRAAPRDEVLTAMREWANRPVDWLTEGTRLLLLVRLLFVPREPGQAFPPLGMGEEPGGPVILQLGVPLLALPGPDLAGMINDPKMQIEFAAKRCMLRPEPLRPPDDPFDLANDITDNHWRGVVRRQLLRLTNSEECAGPAAAELGDNAAWERVARAARAKGLAWDAAHDEYRVPR